MFVVGVCVYVCGRCVCVCLWPVCVYVCGRCVCMFMVGVCVCVFVVDVCLYVFGGVFVSGRNASMIDLLLCLITVDKIHESRTLANRRSG